MSKLVKFLAVAVLLTSMIVHAGVPQNKVEVLKTRGRVYIRSAFSNTKDVVLRVDLGLNGQVNIYKAVLVPKDQPFSRATSEKPRGFHYCGDDATPWYLKNLGYMGGNHGFGGGRTITAEKHGLTIADIGSEWTDEKGRLFYLIDVIDADNVLFLSKKYGKGDSFYFSALIKGKSLTRKKDGKKIVTIKSKKIQIRPCSRITKQAYLVDGKTPLQDDTPTTCDYLDIVDQYDIIAPDTLLEGVKKKPGVATNYNGPDLAPFISNNITYRFLPMGTCVTDYKATAKRNIQIGYMGFQQTSRLDKRNATSRTFYIPKTLPFELKGKKFDFKNIQDFMDRLPAPAHFSFANKNIESQDNMPDRFIQFVTTKDNDQIGYAFGYSLTKGLSQTAKRAKNTDKALFIHTSNKSYPIVINKKMGTLPAGTTFNCVAYRQYFAPKAACPDATCVYWHKQGDATFLFADFHKSVNKTTIKLPANLTGKKMTIIEKTPTVTMDSSNTVPANGIGLSIKDNYGFIVIKLD